ncbi:sterol desaturase family protein [Sphingomonas psychrolutea]|uniref:Sterol desaturase n=1 Tax=Sphingomonas psychrolutea TaxID=1259676 RepID=A0ABQ1GQ31_9SPHN|nr:sterol desaturase family protein [Sphingomonas psychrolutea]GGA47443.1 sterol desaturase [Sphingomonas psychrolutea]
MSLLSSLTPMLSEIANETRWAVQIEFERYLAGAAGVAILYWLIRRWIEPRRIQAAKPSLADRRREFGQSVQAILVFSVVNLLTFAMYRAGWLPISQGEPILGILIAQIVAMVILHDTWFYWMHRTLHLRALFRRAHAAHHRSRTPTSWAAYSFAPIEAVFESIYVPAMFVIVSHVAPMQPWAIFVFLGHQIARNAIGHSGFELAWPGFTRAPLTGWLTTTTHHDLHHTEGRYNFGLYFTWWDRIMGTEHPHYHARFEAVVGRRAVEQPVAA